MGKTEDIAEVLDELSGFVIRQTVAIGELSLTAASTLSRLDSRGPLRLTELAATQGVSQPSMTVMVSRLEKQGLVVRRSDPADRRIVLVEVTEPGRALVGRRRRIRKAFLTGLVGRLGAADRDAIAAATAALHRLVDPAALPAAVAAAEHAAAQPTGAAVPEHAAEPGGPKPAAVTKQAAGRVGAKPTAGGTGVAELTVLE